MTYTGTMISDLIATVERRAARQALDELGDQVSFNDLLARAEQIRDDKMCVDPSARKYMKKVIAYEYRSNNSSQHTVAKLECGHERVLEYGSYVTAARCWDCPKIDAESLPKCPIVDSTGQYLCNRPATVYRPDIECHVCERCNKEMP